MSYFVAPLAKLIEEFNKLPGIGKRTAQRLAFHVINQDKSYAESFAEALVTAKNSIKYCSVCQNITDKEVCSVCESEKRDKSVICVVEGSEDVLKMESLKEFNGVYHVLHGVIDPLNEVGPDDIRIKELLERVSKGDVKELILATNINVQGETTALYIAKLLSPS